MFTEKREGQIELYYAPINAGLFLSDALIEIPSVLGRIEPLALLFISPKEVVLGCHSGQIPLNLGNEYAVEISIPIMRITRTIFITVSVKRIIESPIPDCTKQCAMCAISSIKEEDSRFLYEKLYNKTAD